jgi:hypothetical protein
MAIDLTCSCGKRLQVSDEYAGQQGQCPLCGRVLEIPDPSVNFPGMATCLLPARTESVTPELGPTSIPEPVATDFAETPLPIPPSSAERPLVLFPQVSRPAYRLFSPGQIGLVAFLFGPFGGFLPLAINYYRLGKATATWMTAGVGLVTVAGFLGLGISVPESFPLICVGFMLFLILWAAASGLQGNTYQAHLRNGGQSASGMAIFLTGVLGLGLFLGTLFGSSLLYESFFFASLGQKITYGRQEELYFKGGVTRAEADLLGRLLQEAGYFNGHGGKTVQVSREGSRFAIAFVVARRAWEDAEIQQEFRTLASLASEKVFDGRLVEVRLCDENMRVRKKLEP